MSLFLSELGQLIFYGTYAGIFLVTHFLLILIRLRHSLPTKARFGSGAKSIMLFGSLFFWVFVLVSVLFSYAGIGILPDWTYYLGLSTSILGSVIWFWGHRTLGRYYSQAVVIYEGHQLVERGPYRFVRHPSYTGLLLVYLGIGLAAQSWAGEIVTLLGPLLFATYRIPLEEKALIKEFGEQYIAYSRRVKRLIPFIY